MRQIGRHRSPADRLIRMQMCPDTNGFRSMDSMKNRFLATVWMWVAVASLLLFKPSAGAQGNLPQVKWPRFVAVKLDAFGRIVSYDVKKASSSTVDLGNDVKLEMVRIKGGVFQMGSQFDEQRRDDDEMPHTVRLSGFAMGKYEVTREQWREVARMISLKHERDLVEDPSDFKDSWQQPVENIAWEDAVEFCMRLGKKTGATWRLPTEAEWEYAARAGTQTPYGFGPTITPKVANYNSAVAYGPAPSEASREMTLPAGSLEIANAFGLFDIHGNVWEWCSDWYNADYYDDCRRQGIVIDPLGATTGSSHVLRGGGWRSIAVRCRSAHRTILTSGSRLNDVGFRVVQVGR